MLVKTAVVAKVAAVVKVKTAAVVRVKAQHSLLTVQKPLKREQRPLSTINLTWSIINYKTEFQSLNLANIVSKINALAYDIHDLSTSSPKFQKKFEGGAFKHSTVNSKILVDFPPSPVFDDPYEFFNFKRIPVGVCCPESLFVRYCVYADIFRFLKTGTLTVYGHAYRLKFDKDWEQKSKQLGTKFLAASGGGSKSN